MQQESRPPGEIAPIDPTTLSRMRDTVEDAELLTEYLRSETLSYWMANNVTHRSLMDFLLLDRDLHAQVVEQRDWEMFGREVDDLIPFSPDERQALLDRIDEADFPEHWYQSPTTDEIVLVERWRNWLDDVFDEGNIDHDPNRRAMRISKVLSDIRTHLQAEYRLDSRLDT